MEKQEIEFILQFSLFKYFNLILNEVEAKGLSALSLPKVQKALDELNTFLPPLSNEAKLIFSYYYVYQLKPEIIKIETIEKELNTPSMFLHYGFAWQELAKLGLLEYIKGQGYFMPQKVIDAVAIIDMEYYWPNEKTIIPAEHKKEVFWRLCHE
ncbi:MAG: hypothetical protein J5594_01030 [Elusimicrobiaceae bacterium]|nr:hypothetical protein [Elusimicrobiaceae bacterium]